MTLKHRNRVRRTSGEQVVRELQETEVSEVCIGVPTEDEIGQHADEIYRNRKDAPGSGKVNWLQAEVATCTRKAGACPH